MSPLTYSGEGLSVNAGYERVRAARFTFFQLQHTRAAIRSREGNEAGYLGFALKNHTLYALSDDPGTRFFWGWSNNNVLASYTHRDYGNFGSRSYYFTSFGPSGACRYEFSLWNRKFEIGLLADLQLAGFFLRPSYISGSPEGYLNPDNSGVEAFFRSIELFIPGRAWNLGFIPGIRYNFKSGNAVSLQYRFEYVKIRNPEPVTESTGSWSLHIITLL